MRNLALGAISSLMIAGSLTVQQPAQAAGEPVISLTPAAAFWLWGTPEPTTTVSGESGRRLLTAIRTARAMLQEQVDSQLADTGYRPRVVTSRNVDLEIIAALWNSETDEYDLTRILKHGTTLTPITNTHYRFKLKTDNGVNSEIEVTNRPELQVLGIIHPVFADIGTSTRPRYRLDNVVYIPYSSRLNDDALVQAGEEYLDRKITAVYDELRQLGVRSYAQPDRYITDVMDASVVKTILAIEHVNAAVLLRGDPGAFLRQFYITLATNEHASYAYARSSASARGLVQFIPATYQSLRKLRPELTLHADFVQGMSDPYNAIKAEIALLDYNLMLLPQDVRERYAGDTGRLGAYLAAMYNGGPTRVRRAIAAWGEAWAAYHGNISSSLRSETAAYVAKFNLVFRHFRERTLHLAAR